MRQAARELGNPEPPVEAVRDVIGLGLPEAMAALFPSLDNAGRELMREQYSRCYRTLDDDPAGLFPGALAVLDSLRERGHLWTGSSSRQFFRVVDPRAAPGIAWTGCSAASGWKAILTRPAARTRPCPNPTP